MRKVSDPKGVFKFAFCDFLWYITPKKIENTKNMPRAKCRHKWVMTNIQSGYLVVEGCFHCRSKSSFFSREPVPPIDEYQDGLHFWNHLGNFQASKFDLKCRTCSELVKLDDVMALMLCMNCNPECGVSQIGSKDKHQKNWVYVALCADTSHSSGTCISQERIQALNEYFNAGIKDPSKKIVVVPCSLRKFVDTCQGIVLADVGLTELY